MASYDKRKMLHILEEQRRSFSVKRDLRERIKERRKGINSKIHYLRSCATSAGATPYFEDKLMALSLEDAIALPRESVECFQREKYRLQGTTSEEYSTGISFGDWQELNQERSRMARLQEEEASHSKLHDERFACTKKLVEAVKSWGFNDPSDDL